MKRTVVTGLSRISGFISSINDERTQPRVTCVRNHKSHVRQSPTQVILQPQVACIQGWLAQGSGTLQHHVAPISGLFESKHIDGVPGKRSPCSPGAQISFTLIPPLIDTGSKPWQAASHLHVE